MATKGTFTHYAGPLSSLPASSSPGFLFLSVYMAGIDALDRSSPAARKLHEILAPGATFTNNGGDSLPLSKVELMFGQRQSMLEKFEHGYPICSWDLEGEGSSGGRMVVCECASITVFKADPEKEEVKVAECLVMKLEPAPEGKGVGGLWATEMRIYMDFGAIHMKGKELMSLKRESS